jgi:hypothetical protein
MNSLEEQKNDEVSAFMVAPPQELSLESDSREGSERQENFLNHVRLGNVQRDREVDVGRFSPSNQEYHSNLVKVSKRLSEIMSMKQRFEQLHEQSDLLARIISEPYIYALDDFPQGYSSEDELLHSLYKQMLIRSAAKTLRNQIEEVRLLHHTLQLGEMEYMSMHKSCTVMTLQKEKWVRMATLFSVHNPLLYHQLSLSLYCGSISEQCEIGRSGISEKALMARSRKNMPSCGVVAQPILTQLYDLLKPATHSTKWSGQVFLMDCTNSERFASRERGALLMFAMDVPSKFAAALNLTMFANLHMNFEEALTCENPLMTYEVVTYDIPEYLIRWTKVK